MRALNFNTNYMFSRTVSACSKYCVTFTHIAHFELLVKQFLLVVLTGKVL